MMEFFKLSHDGGLDIQVIIAKSKYEALGFYLLDNQDICCESIDLIDVLPADHNIEVSCVGFPIYKTLEELYKEKEFGDTPQKICGLID